MKNNLIRFITESNGIEGICREPLDVEILEAERFLSLKQLTLDDVIKFVSVCEPKAKLRVQQGLDVTVGNHIPPMGGVAVGYTLKEILHRANNRNESSYNVHVDFELLHPFTDCNGRLGRMIWLWMETKRLGHIPKLGFLHSFYYQTLSAVRQERDSR